VPRKGTVLERVEVPPGKGRSSRKQSQRTVGNDPFEACDGKGR
jgi:hypothetical protein